MDVNYFFALEQEEVDSIENWTNSEIINWAKNKGFHEYINILKYENITGKQLAIADKKYLWDVVGVTKADIITKFLTEINEASKRSFEKPKLYGWGVNSSGQLGVNTGSANVPNPVEVQLPNIDQNIILDIVCGVKQTILVTKNSGIWITEYSNSKKVEKKVSNADEEPSKKKNLKQSEDKEKSANLNKWVNISQQCEKVGERLYKVVGVSASKDYIAALGAYQGHVNQKDSGSAKFKGADHILDRIMWDKKLSKEDFTIGYEDRFLGIMEISLAEFTKKEGEIPTHRIKYYKRNGEIVWDRVKKINLL